MNLDEIMDALAAEITRDIDEELVWLTMAADDNAVCVHLNTEDKPARAEDQREWFDERTIWIADQDATRRYHLCERRCAVLLWDATFAAMFKLRWG